MNDQMIKLKQQKQQFREEVLVASTNESRMREVGDEKAHQELKEFAVEGLAIELMGVFWLFFGAIFATLSKELVEWFIN